jgi:hypothetical protein
MAAQETELNRFIEYKGWKLAGIYRDEGVSGYRKDRPSLDRLLADAKASRFQVAVFPSIDRAGRTVREVIEIDRTLRAAGVETVFLWSHVPDFGAARPFQFECAGSSVRSRNPSEPSGRFSGSRHGSRNM